MMGQRILVVEDADELAGVLIDYLQAAGYQTEWHKTGGAVVERVRTDPSALILLDLMLPEKDGMTICTAIRRFSDIPIIMVTARVEEIDRLLGLESVPMTISASLTARVRAILRRAQAGTLSMQSTDTALVIDEATHEASLDEQAMDLIPAEFRLLARLNASPGVLFTRGQLLDGIHNDHRIVIDRPVDTHIKNLRRKLKAIRGEETIIRSIYGVGYRLDPPLPRGA